MSKYLEESYTKAMAENNSLRAENTTLKAELADKDGTIKTLHKEMLDGYKSCPACGTEYPPELLKNLEKERDELAAMVGELREIINRSPCRYSSNDPRHESCERCKTIMTSPKALQRLKDAARAEYIQELIDGHCSCARCGLNSGCEVEMYLTEEAARLKSAQSGE